MKTDRFTIRQKLGALAYDVPRFVAGLLQPSMSSYDAPWLRIRNRDERLLPSPDGLGVLCDWRWTSDLYGSRVYPSLGIRLLRRCLRDWPIRFESAPRVPSRAVEVSFILGHRGTERLSHLLTTLQTLFAQEDVACEYIVVEQDDQQRVRESIPRGVRHVHNPPPVAGMPYSRSWAFNVGARAARGRVLIFHDADTCAPVRYAAEALRLCDAGFSVSRLQRFVFYLSDETSRFVMQSRRLAPRPVIEAVTQNCEGVTIAVGRESFFQIGGFDEAFVGWGGEDNEFFERCRTLKSHLGMYMPFLHLHHPPQSSKIVSELQAASRKPAEGAAPSARIDELRLRDFGRSEELDPPYVEVSRSAS